VEGGGSRASEAGSGGGEVDPAAAALRWVQQARGWARWAYPWVFSFFSISLTVLGNWVCLGKSFDIP